ncbi:MAG TPA: D-alanyl-D-alanine carboxypeptidase/D-alanyl-D-alanine-endopeptidase [Steroidobacteraceae bacterium]|nr:D-alanyl-D-alanine carboxypeptidase/D-alanyl-D-alanine-endopeptidase [Steroidobacteraceae bacterium]
MRFRFASLALGASLAATAVADELPPGTRAVLTRHNVPESSVSIVVRDVATGGAILELNAAMPRPPASTMKILPTWAALDLLGPAYSWKTRAWADAPVTRGVLKGNLYLQGGGDPLLTIERWWRFVNDLRQTGLRVIEGDIVVDQTRFTAADERPEDFDGKFWRTYNVLPDAMLVNWQSSDFTIRPSDDGAGIDLAVRPFPEGLVVENRVKLASGRCVGRNNQVSFAIEPSKPDRVVASGRLSAACGPQSQRLAIMEPAQYAWGTFVTLWRQAGGVFRGGMLRAPTPPAARLLLTHESEPLSEIVRVTNKYSSNMMARSLVLAIAAEMNGTPATSEAGEQTIVGWLKTRGLELPELVIGNGSGLSREARITADGMGKLLVGARNSRYAPEFLTSLALGGLDGTLEKRFRELDDPSRIRMKTGTLRDVSCIAGYVVGKSGRTYAIVVFVNHPGAQNGIGEPIQASVIDWALKQ